MAGDNAQTSFTVFGSRGFIGRHVVRAQFGLGRGHDGAIARLAAARGLMAARQWRRGIEELWRVELGGCIESTPAVWKGQIFVGTRAGGFYAIG